MIARKCGALIANEEMYKRPVMKINGMETEYATSNKEKENEKDIENKASLKHCVKYCLLN